MNNLDCEKQYEVIFFRDEVGVATFVISEMSANEKEQEIDRPFCSFRKCGSLRAVLNLAVDRFISSAEKPEAQFFVHSKVDNKLIQQQIFLVEEKKQRLVRTVDLITDILLFVRNSELKIVGLGNAIFVEEVSQTNEKLG
jgi:hypothetical protein